MARFRGRPDFDHSKHGKIGILLANLGTPDAPTAAAVRRYLGEFLWDRRLVEIPRPLWWLILHGIILRLRPAKVAVNYAKIWTDDGSPLLAIAKRQTDLLRQELDAVLPDRTAVALGMRYGTPSIAGALRELADAGARKILVLPLYPQYAAATTASVFDAVAAELANWRWVPELRFVQHYHDHPAYIGALAASIRESWETNGRAARLLLSFHGLPKRVLLEGDPYFCECQKTARLLADRLQIPASEMHVVFQSRFGREEWLKPYCDATLESWGKQGVESVDVACPGFSADCLETLEEISMTNREIFQEAGGGEYRYIPALNERADHIALLMDLVRTHVQGWPEAEASWSLDQATAAATESAARAKSLGAVR